MQELEEAMYWMKLLIGAGIVEEQLLEALCKEANEIMAILVTCTKKVKTQGAIDRLNFLILQPSLIRRYGF